MYAIRSYYDRMRGGLAANNQGIWQQKWGNYWDYVRLTNEFLDRIDDSPAMQEDPDMVNILKAEMKFLRANLYVKLVNLYGGVPIMENALGLTDDFNLSRDSYEACVEFIVSELDEAAAILPTTRPDAEFGRATKLSALAVKSRILLYAASKLRNNFVQHTLYEVIRYQHIYVNFPTEVGIYPNGLPGWGGENGANPYVMSSTESGFIKHIDNDLRGKFSFDLNLDWITEA